MAARVVLLIEDREDERIILRTILDHYGYEVRAATSVAEVARLAGMRRPDLVVFDLDLAGGAGLTSRDVQRLVGRPVPVIGISAYDADAPHTRAFGADRFLSKPFLPRALVRVVAGLLGPGG